MEIELGNIFDMIGDLDEVEDFADLMDWYLDLPLIWELGIAFGLLGIFILCVVFVKNLFLG